MEAITRMLDRNGDDITPFCMDDDFEVMERYGQCSSYATCPNYYEGCYRDLMRMRNKEKTKIR